MVAVSLKNISSLVKTLLWGSALQSHVSNISKCHNIVIIYQNFLDFHFNYNEMNLRNMLYVYTCLSKAMREKISVPYHHVGIGKIKFEAARRWNPATAYEIWCCSGLVLRLFWASSIKIFQDEWGEAIRPSPSLSNGTRDKRSSYIIP